MALPIGRIGWDRLPGLAKDIGVAGPSPSIAWVIGTNRLDDDFGIFRWAGDIQTWVEVDGGGVRISVGGDGTPWIVNSSGAIFRRQGDQWEQLPGLAKDVGVSFDGSVWVIGTNPVGTANDFGVFRWDGSEWEEAAGGRVQISVGDSSSLGGEPWIVNSAGQIFRAVDIRT